jgi:S1-C subfamily serine protease
VVTEIGCSGLGPDGGQLWAMLALDTEVAPGTIVYDGAGVVGMVITPDDDGPGSVVAPMELLGALARTRAETGTMQRAWLGMSVGGDGSSAPVITEVQPGSPAEAAGLAVGDTVVAIDGHRIDVPGRFLLAAWASAGAPMMIELERAGAPLNVTVTPQLKNVDLLSASAAPAA